ncbi:hypothetical protein NA56DRAFT_280497 [Hyaloscypha hepaticicola]|uniref:Uncharacterized protein n=1 Tax=Hyaloscypha hepaticicola TaxID=2082293 RepID=A0A2J6PSX4_9HELO|nr:hypothetical protein NA56DRAFT_280497 [Hyaloscypha hepaticicola]
MSSGLSPQHEHICAPLYTSVLPVNVSYTLSQIKRSPDVNQTAMAFVRVEAPFSAGKCTAGYDENASNRACTDDK